MSQGGGCNLLLALKKVFKLDNFDSIVVILGTVYVSFKYSFSKYLVLLISAGLIKVWM